MATGESLGGAEGGTTRLWAWLWKTGRQGRMREGAQERPLGTLEKTPGSQNTSSKESGGQALGTQSRSPHCGESLGLGLGLAQLNCRDFCNTWDFRAQLYLTPVERRGTGVHALWGK